MNQIKFAIIAIPEITILTKLNNLKKYFYTNSFRYENKSNITDVHVTLASGICDETDIENIKKGISKTIKKYKPIKTKYLNVTNERRGPVQGKCEFDNVWVAFLFDDPLLKKLAIDIDSYLVSKDISITEEYINSIKSFYNNKIDKEFIIANHMNLCNYCRPEKSEEAKRLIEKIMLSEIIFDHVALRLKSGSHAWEISL